MIVRGYGSASSWVISYFLKISLGGNLFCEACYGLDEYWLEVYY